MELLYYFLILLAFISLLLTSIGLIRATLIEHKIKQINKEKENRVAEIKKIGSLESVMQGRVKALEDSYAPEIKRLEMNRRFILDKLPFLKR